MVQMLTAGTAAGCEGRKGASSDGRAERKTGAICTCSCVRVEPLLRSHIAFQALDDVSRSFIEDLKEREREKEARASKGNCNVEFCTA